MMNIDRKKLLDLSEPPPPGDQLRLLIVGRAQGESVELQAALAPLHGISVETVPTLARLSIALQKAGHAGQSLSHLERLLGERQDLPAGVDRIEIRIAQARNLEMVGRHDEAMGLLEEAFHESSPVRSRQRWGCRRCR